jgi:hypothetical protein
MSVQRPGGPSWQITLSVILVLIACLLLIVRFVLIPLI